MKINVAIVKDDKDIREFLEEAFDLYEEINCVASFRQQSIF